MKELLKDITLPFALIALILGLALLFIARRQASNAGDLAAQGREAVAQVTKKRTHTTSHTQDNGAERLGVTEYIVEYEFAHPDTRKVWTGSATVDPKVWESMEEGLHYKVTFSEVDPSLSSLFDGEEFKSGAALADYLGEFLAVLGVCGLFLDVWLRRRRPSR